MKRKETILLNIAKELNLSNVEKYGQSETERFFNDAKRYIKAIKEGRIICNIESVSASGMSRNIKFLECSGNIKNGYRYYNFYSLFKSLGHTKVRNAQSFRIYGCGMDMIFHTNYSIMHNLKNLGFISKNECSKLAQETPTVI